MRRRWLVQIGLLLLIALKLFFRSESTMPEEAGLSKFPDSLIIIDDMAFEGTALTRVILPERLEAIGERAFAMIPELDFIVIPQRVSMIGDDVFLDSKVSSIIVEHKSFAEKWAFTHRQSYLFKTWFVEDSRVLLLHGLSFLSLFIWFGFVKEVASCLIQRRNLQSLRRRDRPEMDIPEAQFP